MGMGRWGGGDISFSLKNISSFSLFLEKIRLDVSSESSAR